MSSPSKRPQRTLGISLKIYFTPQDTLRYYRALEPILALAERHNIHIFLIPSILTLPLLLLETRALHCETWSLSQGKRDAISLGAQDCSPYDSGAYTGEISPRELALMGCEMVELGHAERRRLFGETDESVARKAEAVLRNNMMPLVCIGEQNESSVENAVKECTPQITSILSLPTAKEREIIFAYEPVWAIGQPKPASAEYVVSVTKALREVCRENGGEKVRIIYGGSAGLGSFEGMREGVDGLFLGRFGHDVECLKGVIEEMAR
jgi:triosephosphate isomerase